MKFFQLVLLRNEGRRAITSVLAEFGHVILNASARNRRQDELCNSQSKANSAVPFSLNTPKPLHAEASCSHASIRAVLLLGLCALFALQTQASAQEIGPELITNGDFEAEGYNGSRTQTPSGWLRSGNTGGQHRNASRAGPGGAGQYFPLGGWNGRAPANLWQDVSLDVGATYELSFVQHVHAGPTTGTPGMGRVFAGSETLGTFELFRGDRQTSTFQFRATEATTRIEFELVSFPSDLDWDIDNVSLRLVAAASAEEPFGALHDIIVDEAARDLGRQLQTNRRANRDARERLVLAQSCQVSQQQGDDETAGLAAECGSNGVSRNVPLSFTGAINATTASANLVGNFFSETNQSHGQTRRTFFGDFDVMRFNDGDVAASLNARIAWEQPFAEDALFGYFVGTNVSHSDLDGSLSGTRVGYGLAGGVYFVDALRENLYWDGFAALSLGQNDLDVRDTAGDISGDYTTASVQLGLALSGHQKFSQFEMRPELSLSYGATEIGNVDFSVVTSTSTLQEALNAGRVELGRLSFAPEFLFPLETTPAIYDESTFRVTPSVTCEYLRTTRSSGDCGGGLGLEWNASSSDGLNEFSVALGTEHVGGVTKNAIGLQFKSEF